MKEQTVVLIKPDAVLSGWTNNIIKRYTGIGLHIIEQHQFTMTREQVAEFYAEHKGELFFTPLLLGMSSGEMVALILEGEDAIARVRELNGATDPRKAEPGTIRADFRSGGGVFNTVHGSANTDDAQREISLIRGWVAGLPRKIKGRLQLETEMVPFTYILYEDNKGGNDERGYNERTHVLENGDTLIIYKKDEARVEWKWEGVIEFIINTSNNNGWQKGFEYNSWTLMFINELRAELIKKEQ